MRATVQRNLPPMEVQKLDCEQSTPVKRVDGFEAIVEPLAWVGRALGRAGISQKIAAAEMGISESLLSRQMSPHTDAHLSLRRLGALPAAFWREFLSIGSAAIGMPGYSPDMLADHELMTLLRQRLTGGR